MNRQALILCLLTTNTITSAGSMGAALLNETKKVVTLNIGPSWYEAGKTQTFLLQPDVKKTYDANKENHTLGSAEFFYGWQKSLNTNFSGQIGAALAVTTAAKLSGDIWEDADPDFNNFYYNYKVEHVRIAMKGKLLAEMGQIVTPYFSGSIGIGFNRAKNFLITPKIFEEIPAPAFTSNSRTSLSYTLGAGVQKQLAENWHAGIGYEFADWGKSNLSQSSGQTLNTGLVLNHLYTNQLQFNLSYIA